MTPEEVRESVAQQAPISDEPCRGFKRSIIYVDVYQYGQSTDNEKVIYMEFSTYAFAEGQKPICTDIGVLGSPRAAAYSPDVLITSIFSHLRPSIQVADSLFGSSLTKDNSTLVINVNCSEEAMKAVFRKDLQKLKPPLPYVLEFSNRADQDTMLTTDELLTRAKTASLSNPQGKVNS